MAVETEADVVEEIAMMVDLISLPKQPTIAGTTQNPMADGTTKPTIRLIASKTIENRPQIPMIALDVRAVVVAAGAVDVIVMKDSGTTKKSPTATVMMRGASQMATTAIAVVMMVRAMKRIAQAEANDLVEAAIVVRAAKAMHVMIDQPVTASRNVQGAVVAVVAI